MGEREGSRVRWRGERLGRGMSLDRWYYQIDFHLRNLADLGIEWQRPGWWERRRRWRRRRYGGQDREGVEQKATPQIGEDVHRGGRRWGRKWVDICMHLLCVGFHLDGMVLTFMHDLLLWKSLWWKRAFFLSLVIPLNMRRPRYVVGF